MFDPVDPKQSFPKMEEGILRYWQEEDIFGRSLKQRASDGDHLEGGQGGEENYSFYDGPPFATGLPHYGHLLAGTVKDVIPRYQTMRGKYVQRRFGWDCHGLPIENLIEKEHNIQDKQEIEDKGVRWFNDLCRSSVQRYAKEWRDTVERMGRWVDMDWDYKTMDPNFMESIWHVFKTIYDKELIYEGHKAMHICPRCATPLSNFEVTLGYSDRNDMSVIMTFPLKDDPTTELLAWTTTPWSLPGHMWLAVGKGIPYSKVKEGEKHYILATNLVETVFKNREYEVVEDIQAEDLVGLRYEPLFPYFVDTVIPSTEKAGTPETYGERVFHVVMEDVVEVSDAEGTGIVHVTSCLGGDSYALAQKMNVDLRHHVTIDGLFTDEVTDFPGVHVKPEGDDPMATDKLVIENLKKRGRYFSSYTVNHSYPHCWRCDTPLLPYTTSSWFVAVEAIKEQMLANNAKTTWVPSHIRDGRFGKWVENARDWAISRNRYWGTPLPIWRCADTGDIEVIGSRDTLMQKSQLRFGKFTLVRHGESEGNTQHLYQGEAPGTPLTKNGQQQAATTAQQLSIEKVDTIYCSPLLRAKQTAEAIAKETGAEVIVDERLKETGFGEHEGTHYDMTDLELMRAKRAKKLDSDGIVNIYHLPGMESWEQVAQRTHAFLEEVMPKHRSEHVVIVSHGDPIKTMQNFFTKAEPEKLNNQRYHNYAEPRTYFWDYSRSAELDLHKDTVDTVSWTGPANPEQAPCTVTLMRHGETEWNKERRTQGSTKDVPLTEQGREEVRQAASKLNADDFDVLICSSLDRAVESAEIISEALGLPITEKLDILMERKGGESEGKIRSEVPAFADLEDKHTTAMHYDTPDGAETLSEFIERAEKARQYLMEQYSGKRVLVVAHGGTMQAFNALHSNLSYQEARDWYPKNGETKTLQLDPLFTRIPDVLDCWFESGSMPYAQQHYPFHPASLSDKQTAGSLPLPSGFPANFIAENLDQTRGWFYTLLVLSTALFDEPAFHNCICGGMVLAEDGKKMSKKLKNYPAPEKIMDQYGADALRFALMSSPVVRAESLRFSEKGVAQTVQSVLLPLWNAYAFFVTYANDAKFDPSGTRGHSNHPLDQWIRAEVQDLVNRMTTQFDAYDLSAVCDELGQTIDGLTNWYIRLSRKRFAGKESLEDRTAALETLYDVLLTLCQVLSPICPYITDAIYINLVPENHTSIHLSDWPKIHTLSKDEEFLIQKTRLMRTVVSLGLKVRADSNVKNRQPLSKSTIALPPSHPCTGKLAGEDVELLKQELNVKQLELSSDPGELGEAIVQVDARKVGPRLGKRVQDIIRAGKEGEFSEQPDGTILILDETFSPDEAQIVYRGKDGAHIAADHGVVVSLDTELSDDLKEEGILRDLIRTVQRLRKEQGFKLGERIVLFIDGAGLSDAHLQELCDATVATIGANDGKQEKIDIDGTTFTISFTHA